jgi:hypothetical protein
VADLAVADARRLVEAGAGRHAHAADALVFEYRPALQHVDELHVDVVPVLRRGRANFAFFRWVTAKRMALEF